MTQEEKAKAYDNILEQFKGFVPDEKGLVLICPTDIFPELKKNENDEETRQMLIQVVNITPAAIASQNRERLLAWLENQKLPKWGDDDKKIFGTIADLLYDGFKLSSGKPSWNEIRKWLLSIRKKPIWRPTKQNIEDLEWCSCVIKDKMGSEFHRLQVLIDEIKELKED